LEKQVSNIFLFGPTTYKSEIIQTYIFAFNPLMHQIFAFTEILRMFSQREITIISIHKCIKF